MFGINNDIPTKRESIDQLSRKEVVVCVVTKTTTTTMITLSNRKFTATNG